MGPLTPISDLPSNHRRGKYGRWVARQQFVLYDKVAAGTGPGYAGTILRMACAAKPVNFSPELCGIMKYFASIADGVGEPIVMSEGALVAKIMDAGPDWPCQVSVQFLETRPVIGVDGDLSWVEVIGIREACPMSPCPLDVYTCDSEFRME